MSHKLILTGLDGSQPLGFMAALGLLRSLHEMPEEVGLVRLRWQDTAPYHPVLVSERALAAEDVIGALVRRQAEREHAPELMWSDDIKVSPSEFAEACGELRSETALDFMAAFGSDAVRSGERIATTPFYMVSGQQRLLRMARELAASLRDERRNKAADAFGEALFGPWRYEDRFHSFGWDPAAERLHALRAQSPTSEDPRGVRAAIWLAFESLALLPSVPGGARLSTIGFERNRSFSWPLWTPALGLEAVRTVIGHRAIVRSGLNDELRARGIVAVFRAQRMPIGTKGYATFRPPALFTEQP